MKGNTRGMGGRWVTLLVAGGLLAGCSAQGVGDGSSRPTGSSARAASPKATTPPAGGSAATPAFTPDADLVPRTSKDGRDLVDSVVFAPADWGRGYVAQDPAASAPGTWAVLDDGCRWGREKLPREVLASLSRYSLLPAGKGKGAVKVTAAATAHASVLGADEQLSTTLEEVLRCPEQRPRTDERITGLNSLGTPFGTREQEYADDSILEAGQYVERGGAAQQYQWMVARLGTIVVAVSVTGGKGHTPQELQQLGSSALGQMLVRVQKRLKEK